MYIYTFIYIIIYTRIVLNNKFSIFLKAFSRYRYAQYTYHAHAHILHMYILIIWPFYDIITSIRWRVFILAWNVHYYHYKKLFLIQLSTPISAYTILGFCTHTYKCIFAFCILYYFSFFFPPTMYAATLYVRKYYNIFVVHNNTCTYGI